MNLGVQYYRPPFPDSKYWKDDFSRIKDSGLNTVQLWVIWAWVEAKPGHFNFDDYDRLVELAGENGLGLILSAIAEIQPYWIHREVPDSEMIDHMGYRVISSNRQECHFGLTPGGCTDHPGVWTRMSQFLSELVLRYRNVPHLRGWDAWNELRWNVNADGLVCFCPHTLKYFRAWLSQKYGGLENLNHAWKRRYNNFEEILPGKKHDRTYTEMMAFQHFITHRADEHAAARYKIMKPLDPNHPVTVHSASPSPTWEGWAMDYALSRGNDWFMADALDGVGCSSFPKWGNMDDADFALRVEYVKSAAGRKSVWLSEVQGGRAGIGFNITDPVDAVSQQRWIWNGISRGADTILFWCWRDEVFGCESANFGIAGNDGLAEERLAALRVSGKLLSDHSALLEHYQPEEPVVGILFSPQSYYLAWSQEGNAGRCASALRAYGRALIRHSIPFRVLEESHLECLSKLKILFLPHLIVSDERIESALTDFVQNGGVLVCESECGAFSPEGFYRYPEDRFTTSFGGIQELGRRQIKKEWMEVKRGTEVFRLRCAQWVTPLQTDKATVMASNEQGSLAVEVPVGKGRVIFLASYPGTAHMQKSDTDFEAFVRTLVQTAGEPLAIKKKDPTSGAYFKYGRSGDRRVIFVFAPAGIFKLRVTFTNGFFNKTHPTELISGNPIPLSTTADGVEGDIPLNPWGLAILADS